MGVVHVRAGEIVAAELGVRPSGTREALAVRPVFGEVVEETAFSNQLSMILLSPQQWRRGLGWSTYHD